MSILDESCQHGITVSPTQLLLELRASSGQDYDYLPADDGFLPLPVHVIPDLRDRTRRHWSLALIRTAQGRIIGILCPEIGITTDRILCAGFRRYPPQPLAGSGAGWLYTTTVSMRASELTYNAVSDANHGSPFKQFLVSNTRDYLAQSFQPVIQNYVAEIRKHNASMRVFDYQHEAHDSFLRLSRIIHQRALQSAALMVPKASLAPQTLRAFINEEPAQAVSPSSSPAPALTLEIIKPSQATGSLAERVAERLAAPRSGANGPLLGRLSKGLRRPLLAAPKPEVLDPLYVEWPNFKAALDIISSNLALCARAPVEVPLRLPPILLAGSPGIGKSAFCIALARALGFGEMPPVEVDFATASAGWILSGLSSTWDGAKHGLVLENFLDESSFGNGFIVGNEIDKASTGDQARHNPLGPLLTLLEPSTAGRFRDEFAEVSIDASHLNWFLTANDIDNISDPLLTRIEVVSIPVPTFEQQQGIASRMYATACASQAWGASFPAALDAEVLERLAQVGNPRELKRALQKALGNAARAGAPCVLVEHVETGAPQRRSIGFR